MSTQYSPLKTPYTNISREVDGMGETTKVTVWIGEYSFTCEPPVYGNAVFWNFVDEDGTAAHTYWGGADMGKMVDVTPGYPDETVVVSEYGEITTVGRVKQEQGRGKRK